MSTEEGDKARDVWSGHVSTRDSVVRIVAVVSCGDWAPDRLGPR